MQTPQFTKPITSIEFSAGEPAWSVAAGNIGSAVFYELAAFLWWATSSPRLGAMLLASAVALTPLPPLYTIRWLYRRMHLWRRSRHREIIYLNA